MFPFFLLSCYGLLNYSVNHSLLEHGFVDSFNKVFILAFYANLDVSEPFRFEHCDIFVVILPPLMVRSSREEVCFDVCFAGFMMESKIILLEFGNPSGLVTIHFLWFLEICEVLMICPYFKL